MAAKAGIKSISMAEGVALPSDPFAGDSGEGSREYRRSSSVSSAERELKSMGSRSNKLRSRGRGFKGGSSAGVQGATGGCSLHPCIGAKGSGPFGSKGM